MFHQLASTLLDVVGGVGYGGIFLLMFLESTFFPFPSEIVMIPAGYLVYQGEMELFMVLLMGTLGSLLGAIFNYYFARLLGRKFLLKYGHYFFIQPHTLEKLEHFFQKHGEISTFTGRLIPAIRQLISLPAGLAKMSLWRFSLFTLLGAFFWVSVLVGVGYFFGENQALMQERLSEITLYALVFIALLVGGYLYKQKKRKLL